MKVKLIVVGVLAVLVSMNTAVFGQKKSDYKPAKANDVTAELALTGVPMRMTPDQLPNQFSTQLRNDVKNSKGTAVLKLNGKDVEYTFTWENLTSPVTQAHFHFGPHNQVGARALSICGVVGESPACPGGTSNTISGVWKDANVDAIKAGDVVIAFHTAKYPAPIGEIAVYIPPTKKSIAKLNAHAHK